MKYVSLTINRLLREPAGDFDCIFTPGREFSAGTLIAEAIPAVCSGDNRAPTNGHSWTYN